MEKTLSNRICRPAGDVCAVLHINWQHGWKFPKELLVRLLPDQGCLGIWGSPRHPDSITQPGIVSFSVALWAGFFATPYPFSNHLCFPHRTHPLLSVSAVSSGSRDHKGRPLSVCPALSRAQGLWTPRPTFFTGPHPPGWFETADPWLPTTWMTVAGPHLYPVQRCFLTFPCCLILPP